MTFALLIADGTTQNEYYISTNNDSSSYAPALILGSESATTSKVVLYKTIDIEDGGTKAGIRFGDLTGNGQVDIVLAQNDLDKNITCITAIDLDGNKLWQIGNPDPANVGSDSDIAVQIYDFDLDGENEVLCVRDGMIKVLDGKTGNLEKQGPLPNESATDGIFVVNLSGTSRPQDLLVKDRYLNIWALDNDFNVLWTHHGIMGHAPWPNDFDGDGRDEILSGFTLLSHDGEELWEADLRDGHTGNDYWAHADGIVVGELDGNLANGDEVAYATCNTGEFAVYSNEGEELWKDSRVHAQHIVIGDFRPEIPNMELWALDRGNDRSVDGEDSMILYSGDGKVLFEEDRTDVGSNRWKTQLSTVRNWDGGRDLVLSYRRGGTLSPRLYDGHGNVVAVFPFGDKNNFTQHLDLIGDEREEIAIFDGAVMYIYTNGAANPNKLLYNWTQYMGMP